MTNFFQESDDTILLHAGQEPDPTTGSRALPIYQTTSYVFKSTEHAKNLFALAEPGNIYTRIMNPTTDAFEQRVAALEDGVAAVAVASGMAAITYSILNIASAGDEIVADSNIYGGTYSLFVNTLPKYGITVRLVDGTDPKAVASAINDKTKAVFGETITNPSLNVFDIETIADIAHEHDIPLIIDNTFAPYFSKPAQWGADIIVHSATKWIGGHGTTIGGVVVDAGRFDWTKGKFPGFTEPDESYGGVKFADLGAPAFALKLRVQLLRDTGASISPNSSFLLVQGLETLHLRLKKHNDNAIGVVNFLENHPGVNWVNHPSREDHPTHDLANKYFKEGYGYGSVITFGIKGGLEAGSKLIDNIKLWSHVANVGDAKSLIIHPASTTHQQLDPEGLAESGATEDLVRLAIGIEDLDDILYYLDEAIAIATNEKTTIKENTDDAINWLFETPFDRNDGLRNKTIAVVGVDNQFSEVEKLAKSGYNVIKVTDSVANTLADTKVDVLYTTDHNVSQEEYEAFANQSGKVVWFDGKVSSQTKDELTKNNLTAISEADILDTFDKVRRN